MQVPGAWRPGWGDLSTSTRDRFPRLVVMGREGRGRRSRDGWCVLLEVRTEVAEKWLGKVSLVRGQMSLPPRNGRKEGSGEEREQEIWRRDGVLDGSISQGGGCWRAVVIWGLEGHGGLGGSRVGDGRVLGTNSQQEVTGRISCSEDGHAHCRHKVVDQVVGTGCRLGLGATQASWPVPEATVSPQSN